jgi:peptidoglycan/xylan/chitin deacetylase (PgdA/CDA1 family)
MIHRTPFFLPLLLPSLVWRVPTEEKVLFLTFDDGPVPGPTEFALHTLCRFSAKATFFCIGDNIRKHPDVFHKIIEDGHATGNHTFNHLSGWRTRTKEYIENVHKCQELLSAGAKGILDRSQDSEARSQKSEARSEERGTRRNESETGISVEQSSPSKAQGPSPKAQFFAEASDGKQPLMPNAQYPMPFFRPPYGRITKRQIRQLNDYSIIMWDVLSMDYNKNLSPEACLRNTIHACRTGSIVVFHDSYKAERNMAFVLPRLLEHFAAQGFAFKALPG